MKKKLKLSSVKVEKTKQQEIKNNEHGYDKKR